MKVLIFGASGSGGGSVLRACFSSPDVKEIHAITRRPLRFTHKKLRVFIHNDYAVRNMRKTIFTPSAPGGNAAARREESPGSTETRCRVTPGGGDPRESATESKPPAVALAAAGTLRIHSPTAVFHFISGKGTCMDSHFMWARVKAETERDLMALVNALCWRPGFIDGESSNSSPRIYRILRPMLRLLKPFRGLYINGQDLGRAMLKATSENIRGRVIENAEIRDLANQ